jgi:hypothetical protein
MTDVRTPLPITVQAAAEFPADDATGWTTYATVVAEEWSDGHGVLFGAATLVARWGRRTAPGSTAAPATVTPASVEIPRRYAIRLVRDDSPFWWGYVVDHRPRPDDQETDIYCLEARALLADEGDSA